MLRKTVNWILPIFLSLVTTTSKGDIPEHHAILSSGYYLHVADSLYQYKQYGQALQSYQEALNKSPRPLHGSSTFKIAYSYYRTENFEQACRLFLDLYKNQEYLSVYSEYFYIRSLWNINQYRAVQQAVAFIDSHNKHFLTDSLILPVADTFYDTHNWYQARKYYLKAIDRRVNKVRIVEHKIRAAHCLYHSGKYKLAKDEYYQILKKYERKEETLELARWLQSEEASFAQKHFFNIADVYYANRQYTALNTLLEQYTKKETNKGNKEKARYYLLKVYFARKQYSTALYGFKNLLAGLHNKNLEPRIRLYMARIYLRKGQKNKAVEAYVDYANRYPRRRIAAEAVWKAGWIKEELNDPEGAIELYRMVRTRWPRSTFAKEAYFREGFNYYRLGRYEEADQVFNDIRFRRWPDSHKERAQYWASMCRDQKGDSVTAKRLRLDLAENLWDSYYTMKSYLIHKKHIDSSWSVIKDYRRSNQFLQCHTDGFSNLLPYFDEVYQVYELLGENYAFGSIENVKLVASTPEEWVSLAEIYKQFHAYNKSFRLYGYINNKFYRDIPYSEKLFILKERFPFYHDQDVEKYANRYGLEKEFIFAIMKQESAFDPRAHSWADAFGLMQLIRITAQDMARLARVPFKNTEQLFNPEYNIHLGSLYVKQLARRLEHKEWILAAYNAGPHRVKRWRKIPGSDTIDVFIENIEFRETRNYVKKVMKNYWAYRLLNNGFQLDTDQILIGYRSESGQ
jgi:soluble lytic murein transglycosylase